MSKSKILVQLDCDRHPSLFDRVVAVDAGADEVFSYGGVEPEDVEALVHGAIFTRSPKNLKSTAIFIGGRHVGQAEKLLGSVLETFFGPMRCSVMLDPNGANTTAAAAVLAASRHLDFSNTRALVIGGTGPVGERVVLLLVRQGVRVWLGSRNPERAANTSAAIQRKYPEAKISSAVMGSTGPGGETPERFELVISAAALGVRTLTREQLLKFSGLKVLVDLNAVSPTGIEGLEPTDEGRQAGGIFHYGALGIGGAKMKIHKAAIARLFETNDLVLDAETIFELAKGNGQ